MSSLTGLSADIQRYHESEPLNPSAGPSALDRFCGTIGRLLEQTRETVGNWTPSWHSRYQRVGSGKSDAEFSADGRRALNEAFKTAVGLVPGGALAIAADTERQAILIWLAARETSEPTLKTTLEDVAILKDARAVGQFAGAATKLVPAIGQLPLVDSGGRFAGKKAINFAAAQLGAAAAEADRASVADALYQAAKLELASEDWRDKPAPQLADYKDPRHALYALVVLNVSLDVLRNDLENDGLDGRRYVTLALK